MSPRTARPGRCRTCKATILRGLDADLCAFPTTADPIPLSPIGEALALLAGRQTFHLRRTPGTTDLQLDRRDQWQIAGQPAATPDSLFPADTVAEHKCWSPPLPAAKSLIPKTAAARKNTNNECPY